jgi:hypothetical protein
VEFFKITNTEHADKVRSLLAQLRGVGITGQDDNAEPYDGAEIVQPLGLTARPKLTDTLEALVIRDGDEVIVVTMLDKGISTKTGDDPAVEESETRLHGASADNVTAIVRIKANGDIVIKPKSGQKVYVGDESGAQPMMPGDDWKNYIKDEVKAAIDNLRSDSSSSIGPHTHNGTAGPYPVTTLPSTSLTTIPSGNAPSSVPALSSVSYLK